MYSAYHLWDGPGWDRPANMPGQQDGHRAAADFRYTRVKVAREEWGVWSTRSCWEGEDEYVYTQGCY